MPEILFAEDDEAMREMVTAILSASGYTVRGVKDGTTALAELRARPPDLVVLDYRMGTPDGLEVCRQIRTQPSLESLPVLILTAETDVEDRIDGFAAGANDYLAKPFDPRELLARVHALLRLSEQGKVLNPTTGLPGGPAIEKAFERCRGRGEPFCLCYLDLDYFKPLNDRFGFFIANSIIEAIGGALRHDGAAHGAFAGHIGGDDFVLLCGPASARSLIEAGRARLETALREHLPAEVLASGFYRGRQRDGREDDIPVTRLVAVILHLDPRTMPSLTEIAERAAEAKGEVKSRSGDGIVELVIDG